MVSSHVHFCAALLLFQACGCCADTNLPGYGSNFTAKHIYPLYNALFMNSLFPYPHSSPALSIALIFYLLLRHFFYCFDIFPLLRYFFYCFDIFSTASMLSHCFDIFFTASMFFYFFDIFPTASIFSLPLLSNISGV